eukprot:6209263-Pleurochrysis_carterae.AAC.3
MHACLLTSYVRSFASWASLRFCIRIAQPRLSDKGNEREKTHGTTLPDLKCLRGHIVYGSRPLHVIIRLNNLGDIVAALLATSLRTSKSLVASCCRRMLALLCFLSIYNAFTRVEAYYKANFL